MLVDGGINATMAAAQIRNVDLRTLYQMFVHANNLCSIPADLMAKDMYEIMDTPLPRYKEMEERRPSDIAPGNTKQQQDH